MFIGSPTLRLVLHLENIDAANAAWLLLLTERLNAVRELILMYPARNLVPVVEDALLNLNSLEHLEWLVLDSGASAQVLAHFSSLPNLDKLAMPIAAGLRGMWNTSILSQSHPTFPSLQFLTLKNNHTHPSSL